MIAYSSAILKSLDSSAPPLNVQIPKEIKRRKRGRKGGQRQKQQQQQQQRREQQGPQHVDEPLQHRTPHSTKQQKNTGKQQQKIQSNTIPRPPRTLIAIPVADDVCPQLKILSINARSIKNKYNEFYDTIINHHVDILCITETWLRDNIDDHFIAAACPPSHDWVSFPRHEQRGGGIAFIYNRHIMNVSTSGHAKESHEMATLSFRTASKAVNVACFYRPPNKTNSSKFLEEFYETVLDFELKNSPFIFTGDFNYNYISRSSVVTKIKDILVNHDLVQHVTVPTHQAGNVLDWVVSPVSASMVMSVHVVDLAISDHKGIFIEINSQNVTRPTKIVRSRKLSDINMVTLKEELSRRIQQSQSMCDFNTNLRDVLDHHAPVTARKLSERKEASWFNRSVKQAKREKRRAERKWSKSGLTVHKENYISFKNKANLIIRKTKMNYYHSKFNNISSCKELYCLSNKLLGKQSNKPLPHCDSDKTLAEKFSCFFTEKIETIRKTIDSCPSPPPSFSPFNGTCLHSFEPATEDEIRDIIMKSPSKSCDLDPLPTHIFKDCLDVLLPPLTCFINDSLESGVFPDCFKTAIVKPLLKKNGLNINEFKNYRPVSNLTFLSKVLERLVLKRILIHINCNNLSECFQSAYKKHHSTETAVLKVCNDILNSIDEKQVSLLTLLDLSAAFDTIDHDILIRRLSTTFGIRGTALDWFMSYLTGRKQAVQINDQLSGDNCLLYGVPQGSVLGPVIFTMYTQPLSEVFVNHGMSYHFYADDSQLYKSDIPRNIPSLIASVEDCVIDVKNWMICNKLKLNNEKTEAMLCGRTNMVNNELKTIDVNVNGCMIQSSTEVRNLGVVVDNDLSMHAQVNRLCRVLTINLKKLATVRNYLTKDIACKLVTTLVLSHLDYCNSLLLGVGIAHINKLQVIQNRAAKLILRQPRMAHSLPILYELHWLPVKERINYKTAVLTYKSLNDEAPDYLMDCLKRYIPSRTLRSSSDTTKLQEASFTYKSYGGRSFSNAAPRIWNSLPKAIRKAQTVESFKAKLKHFIFTSTYL